MKDTPIERLKGCPFCGGEARMEYDGEVGRFVDAYVECVACKTIGPLIGNVEGADAATAEATRLWNTRATIEPIPSAGEGERLREALDKLLASSGARGRYHALEYAKAVEEAEASLATLPSEPLRDD